MRSGTAIRLARDTWSQTVSPIAFALKDHPDLGAMSKACEGDQAKVQKLVSGKDTLVGRAVEPGVAHVARVLCKAKDMVDTSLE